jgi:hypothetical protein
MYSRWSIFGALFSGPHVGMKEGRDTPAKDTPALSDSLLLLEAVRQRQPLHLLIAEVELLGQPTQVLRVSRVG